MRIVVVVVVVVIAFGAEACGGVEGSSSALVDARTIDARADAGSPRCSPSAPFGTPTLVPGPDLNTSTDEYNAELTPDQLVMFFARLSGDPAQADIYFISRLSTDVDFGTPSLVPNINGTTSDEFHPSVSPDLLTLYFVSNHAGSNAGSLDVFVATRANVSANFSTPIVVTTVSTSDTERGTYLLPNQSALYFSRYHTGNTDEKIYRAPIGPGGIQSPVEVPIGTFNGGTAFPVVTPDELTIYFGSPTGSTTPGVCDIYVSHRAAKTDPFEEPSKVIELDSSTTYQEPSWISADGCDLYFASNRAGGTGADIYVTHRGI